MAKTDTKIKQTISFRLPLDIAQAVAERSESEELRPSRWALKLVCDTLGFALPKASRNRTPKYATDEQRDAARKESIRKRNERVKRSMALMEAFEKFQRGEITLEQMNIVAEGGSLPEEVKEPVPA